MIMIIGLHYFNGGMGGALKYTESGSVNWYIIRFIESMFIIAVNGFVLITGFCMINKKDITLKKVICLYSKLTLCSIGIYSIFVALGLEKFTLKTLIKASMPLLYNEYWFLKIYIVLFILSPFINYLLVNLNKKTYKKLLLILIIVFSIYDSVMINKIVNDGGYGIINFIVLYTIGGYIKLHFNNTKSLLFWCGGYIFFSTLTFISLFIPIINNNSWNYYFITNILSAVCLFNGFITLKFKSKIINNIATNVFGVFIFHLNPYLLSKEYEIAKTSLFWNSNFMIIHFMITCIGIFIVCLILDKVIGKIIEYIFINPLDKVNILKVGVET